MDWRSDLVEAGDSSLIRPGEETVKRGIVMRRPYLKKSIRTSFPLVAIERDSAVASQKSPPKASDCSIEAQSTRSPVLDCMYYQEGHDERGTLSLGPVLSSFYNFKHIICPPHCVSLPRLQNNFRIGYSTTSVASFNIRCVIHPGYTAHL